jgi:dTDP-4-amino-4,6-dideoxygalactose transaminase
MPIFKKTIFTSFSPNLTGRDTLIAWGYLCLPWRWLSWRDGKYPAIVEKKLPDFFTVKFSHVFDSGRSALYFALKALGAGEGVEVLVQAYTCVVVANAINWTGSRPVYLDIGDDFNIDPADLAKKITTKAKILIIQHTFGQPAKLEEILTIAKQHNLKIIEDCAHSLGARYHGRLTGTFGDIGMLSFGSDKIISCARGGALITNNEVLNEKINEYKNHLPPTPYNKIFQHLMHYPIFYLGKPLYSLKLGKLLLLLAKKIKIINKIIYPLEKIGERVNFYPAKLPNALAQILANQIEEIDTINQHRRQIAALYSQTIKNEDINTDSVYLRYPLLIGRPKKLLIYAKQQGIILGDWYNAPLAPADSKLAKTGYKLGQCPKAELLASQSINLPTDRQISLQDAERIIKVINFFSH